MEIDGDILMGHLFTPKFILILDVVTYSMKILHSSSKVIIDCCRPFNVL